MTESRLHTNRHTHELPDASTLHIHVLYMMSSRSTRSQKQSHTDRLSALPVYKVRMLHQTFPSPFLCMIQPYRFHSKTLSAFVRSVMCSFVRVLSSLFGVKDTYKIRTLYSRWRITYTYCTCILISYTSISLLTYVFTY